ncbi:MAG: hypothetical protein IKV55_05820, partial [Oscillospiraceae bacterium]|nr:hypothetical protein [Oscillospiraceae bacterium]
APTYLAAVTEDMQNGAAFRDAFSARFAAAARALLLGVQAKPLLSAILQLGSSCAQTESELLARLAAQADDTAKKLAEKVNTETHLPLKKSSLFCAMLCVMLF